MASTIRDRLSTGLSGVAGEYFVAAELSRRGYVASINLKNTKGVDILVMNQEATRTSMIQVKTFQGSKREWILSKKADSVEGPGCSTSSSSYMDWKVDQSFSSYQVRSSPSTLVRTIRIG